MYKTTILLIFTMLVTLAITGCENSEEAEYEENKRVVEEALAEMEKEEKINTREGKLDIVQGFTFVIDGNYTYIEGSVTNDSNKNVEYFKITAEYRDKAGRVVDTAYTNSGQTLRPGSEKRFKIMNGYGGNELRVGIIIEEVKYGD